MKNKKEEMLLLSDKTLNALESSRTPPFLEVCLKARRLARLCGDDMYEQAFSYEINGYPSAVSKEIMKIARLAKRTSLKDGKEILRTQSVDEIPSILSQLEKKLNSIIRNQEKVITDFSHVTNTNRLTVMEQANEKNKLIQMLQKQAKNCNLSLKAFREFKLNRISFIYDYLLSKNIELKFGNNIDTSKDNLISRISKKIIKHLPDGVKKLNSCIDNLQSTNSEDWANAETTMRRILSDLAKRLEPDNQSDKYHVILKKYMKEEYKGVSKAHMKFIVDDMNDGTHHQTNRDEAEKLLLHICLFLDEIDWNKIDSK